MVFKGFPNVVTQGQHYNIGEKPAVILYTNIDHYVGTPKQKTSNKSDQIYNIFGLRVPHYVAVICPKNEAVCCYFDKGSLDYNS